MKKIIFKTALICSVFLLGLSAEAAIVDKIQPEGGTVYVEGSGGSADKIYTLTVIKKGADLEKLKEEKPPVYYQGEIGASEDGSTELTFKMPLSSESGDYVIRVLNGDKIENYEFSYFSASDRQLLIDKINSGIKANIDDVLTNGSDVLGLALGEMAKIDMSGVSERIYNKVVENPDYTTNPTFDEKSFIEFYKESVVLEAYAQAKSDFLIKDGILQYNEYTKLNETAIYDEYQNSLLKSGMNYVNNAVISARCSSPEEIAAVFEENMSYAVISHYKSDGYGHVNKMLETYKDIFKNRLGVDFTYYDDLSSSKKTVFARELDVRSIDNLSKLKKKIEDTAKSVYNQSSDSDSSGSSGGGGGGGGIGGGTAGGSIVSDGISKIDVSVPAQPVGASSAFSDLNTVEWARESIEYLASKNIVNGKAEGKFYPDDNIKREEFAKIICLAFNISTDGATSAFSDVKANEWYYPYVSALLQRGVITGIDEESFGTGINITREQMAVIIARMSDVKVSNHEEFADDAQISDYAKDAVYAMKESGVINGIGNNLFNPQGIATRAEAAKIVYSAINKFVK